MTDLLFVVGAALAGSFMCSILEAVLLSVSHSYIALLQSRGHRAGDILNRMKREIDEPIAAILTLNTIAHTVGSAWGGAIVDRVYGDFWLGVFVAVLTFVVLVASEIIPKTLGATFCNQLAAPTAHLLRFLVIVMKPVLVPLAVLSRWIRPAGTSRAAISRAEIGALAELGRQEGAIDENEFQVLSNVMQLDEITVGEVMTPRIDMVAVPVEATVADAMDVMLDRGKLRLPVYEGNLDRIVGILLARDLWRAAREGSEGVREVARPARFAPDSKPVEELIREMRAQRTKMIIVLDEFGGTAGLVTLEDLIEEIVGEIQDEHEGDEPRDFRTMEDGRVVVWGGTPVKDVQDRLGIELGEEFDTIGGYVFGALEGVGKAGDSVDTPGGRFRVLKVSRRRIEYVLFDRRE
ncbi:MAG: HlyC/CorC family transporter [Gemmatimonadetes bacterium]|nr:HlyC/CorC family transporter [Gemmatimonadota bacterium]MYB99778.1 HlyC/CorC family transporter [Gemmatimonadota bacterium]MYI46168.1 HlyC/CorC family transporter [Gemmatimonadota bacterium]